MLRLIIADDHAFFRTCLRRACADEPGLEVVGEAGTGQEALDLTAQLQPDVVLMDLEMPVLDGIQATRLIATRFPLVGVLILVTRRQDESLLQALRAGAQGYVLKGDEVQDLVAAIRCVGAGGAWITR